MRRQHVFIWTGGLPSTAEGDRAVANTLPVFPDPAPLHRSARITYQWGDTAWEILATACSVRSAPWGSAEMTWLHCKALPAAEVAPQEPTALMAVLIPASFVTRIEPGPTFRLTRSRHSEDLGVFPPNQPAPANALPLAEIERVLTELLASERN
jgi:hypothetical protein